MKKIFALGIVLMLAACQSNVQLDEGRKLIGEGRIEEGLAAMEQAARATPRNTEAYNTWVTQRESIVGGFVREGDLLRNRGEFSDAERDYRRALGIDPTSAPAQNGLDSIIREKRHQLAIQEAEEAYKRNDFAKADELTRGVLKENANHRAARSLMKEIADQRSKADITPPQLKLALNKPITLEFRDAPMKSIFEVISRSSGINFVFDRDVRQDLRATIFMRNTNLDEVIRILLTTNQLGRKVLNENSILIFPNTPAKQKDYQDLAVRSFYLTNADVKQTAAMIRALVKTRDIYIDEKLNLLVMKDTPDAIRLAEHLVATQDLGEPEVVLELEVLEVASSLLRDFGIRYPEVVNIGVIPTTTTTGTTTTTSNAVTEVKPSTWDFFVLNPAMKLNLQQIDGAVNTLANPRIRVRNREKAKIHIGEKVPVITSTSTANVGVSSSVNYLEVGLKLDVEPDIHLDNEVAMKVQLEVSNILDEVRFQDTISYRLGTRNATTVLRLHDGDTQVLAGLIQDEDRRAANKVPYLGDFPLLGRLFRADRDQSTKTEIVLLITPRIVRNLARPDTVAAQFASGTDAAPGSPPLRLTAAAPGSFGMTPAGGSAAPAPRRPQVASPTSPQAPTGDELALAMSGPSEVNRGEEFVLSFGLPMRAEGAIAQVQLSYDANVLALVSGAQGGPGRATVEVVAPSIAGAPAPVTQVRFRAVAKAPTTGQIIVENVRAADNAQKPVNVASPGAHFVAIGGDTQTNDTPSTNGAPSQSPPPAFKQ